MFERIRRRLTLGYIGIFALILVVIGVVVVVSFWRQAAAQQDELLAQKARGTSDWVRGPALRAYQEGRDPVRPRDRADNGPVGPIESSTEPNIGVVALVPPDDANSEGEVLASSLSSSSFGLPFEEPAQRAVRDGVMITESVDGPGGERLRVVSVPEFGIDGGMAVIQAAQPRGWFGRR